MPLSNEDIYKLARDAVKKMHKEKGDAFTFPADLIWQYTPKGVDIPGPQKPHQPARLMKEGFLDKTGGMTRAVSEARAGSLTAEYRFGTALIGQAVPTSGPPAGVAMSASDALKRMQDALDAEGYLISPAELANFFLAMTVSPLVILSGISGTGKSLLPRKFAQRTNSTFHAIPVQPQWSDNSDLFGYVPTLSPDKYIRGALIDSLSTAKKNPGKLVMTLLDEMNLAPVEHYFSDFLSVAETRARKGAEITTDALPIELPSPPAGASDPYAELRGTPLPSNLRIVGTANMDETTHTFSPKVLDRAFTIELDDPDLTSFAVGTSPAGAATFEPLAQLVIRQSNALSVLEAWASNQDLFRALAVLLGEIQDILSPAGIRFGYRTRDAILLYLHSWKELKLASVLSGYAALDYCILQKILPKVVGTGEALADALKALAAWLRAFQNRDASTAPEAFIGPLTRSLGKVERMGKLLELDGSTRFWGT